MCADSSGTMKTKFALSLLAASLFAASLSTTGCAVDTDEAAEGDESEENLTQEQADAKRVERIRKAAVTNVDQERITLPKTLKAPSRSPSYRSPAGPSLYGVDWFQKWPGGVSANHDWSMGTEFGKRCMWASTLRFEAIMKDPPAELKAFLAEYTRWSGSFYNWVDDHSKPESYSDASGARLWAWRTGLTKWISAAAQDGSCYLPTRKMVVNYVATCKAHQAANDGQMEGCSE
jgi:hypothetical protein